MSLGGDLQASIIELANLLIVTLVTFRRGLIESSRAGENLFELASRVGLAHPTKLELALLLVDIMCYVSVMEQIRWLLIAESMV